MQQSSYHDMQVDSLGAFSARNPLDSLAVAAPGRTRCVNAENPTGGKGTAATAASALGPSRKGSPCIQTVKAGESVTLMDVDGPGVIRHIWMTVTDRTSPTGPNVLRNLILEFYWDGEETPSVQCPIGDFFCCGHAQACRVNSMPVVVVPNRGFNCYFSMPFEHARIVLRNDHNEDVPAFFYQIDYTEYDALPADTMRFMRSGVASASPNWPATMWCSTACRVVARISARIWRSPRWKAAGGARVKSRCTSMGTTGIPRGAAPVPRIISVARGVLPISTSMGVCMSRRSVRRTSVSHSIRSVSPRIARARIGM